MHREREQSVHRMSTRIINRIGRRGISKGCYGVVREIEEKPREDSVLEYKESWTEPGSVLPSHRKGEENQGTDCNN